MVTLRYEPQEEECTPKERREQRASQSWQGPTGSE